MGLQFTRKSDDWIVIDPAITNNHGDPVTTGSIAWACAQLVNGGVIELVPGTYTITQAIDISYDNTSIIGQGKSCIIYMDQSNNDYMIDLNGKDKCVLKDFQLKGDVTGANSKSMIYSPGASNVLSINGIYVYEADELSSSISISKTVQYSTLSRVSTLPLAKNV